MLTLPIKRKWFDMIASGEKREEYRDLSPYYHRRLDKYLPGRDAHRYLVILRAGYRHDSPKIQVSFWLDVGEGRPEWGAEPRKKYLRLHITDVLKEGEAEWTT